MNAMPSPALPTHAPDTATDASETAHGFGEGLIGILHRACGHVQAGTALILLNAGLVHRIGPHRGGVDLARVVAEAGFPVFRYDQSGLGDSPVSAQVAAERRHVELLAAMALVGERTGATRFVVGGICSAADDAFHLAAIEPRIHGVLLLDGLAYRTAGYWWRYLPSRISNPAKVWNWWRARRSGQPAMENFRDWPARPQAVAALEQMVAREVHFLFVFTGGAYRYFNHAGQLRAALGRAVDSNQVSADYWPECDHTFYLARDRVRLAQRVVAWLHRQTGTTSAVRHD